MQFDSMRIAIRERNFLDILDLSLHVVRAYAKPLLLTSLFCVVPLMLINHALLGWMLENVAYQGGVAADSGRIMRFLWAMTLLIFIEAPLASLMATVFLGDAAFNKRTKLWQIAKQVFLRIPHLVWIHGLWRGVGLAWLLVLSIPHFEEYSVQEGLLVALAIWVFFVRALRPFMNEIVFLEQTPLFATRGGLSIGKRSAMLHGPSGADIFTRWLAAAFFGFLLFLAFYGTFIFASGVLLNDWRPGPIMIKFCAPLSMWLVAIYFTVVRYLSYLDLRIKHEGWEVHLRIRAEAVRLSHKVT